jgi:hypothetical protein
MQEFSLAGRDEFGFDWQELAYSALAGRSPTRLPEALDAQMQGPATRVPALGIFAAKCFWLAMRGTVGARSAICAGQAVGGT